jgi:hypothetical protein
MSKLSAEGAVGRNIWPMVERDEKLALVALMLFEKLGSPEDYVPTGNPTRDEQARTSGEFDHVVELEEQHAA